MPELPEVETTKRGIEPLILNRTVARVQINNASLRWPVSTGLITALPGSKVLSVTRRSKYLLVKLTNGTLIVHLGMTGHLRCDRAGTPLRKHDHVELYFTDSSVLRYNDARRFGAILWTTEDPLQHERLVRLGPEPFDDEFSGEYLYRLSRNRKVAVKPFLMNASVVVGVGNIYASEALFRARVSPKRLAGHVGKAAFERLAECVKEVLAEAISAGGTTIRDFADTEGKPGYFVQELQVYGREGEPCKCCGEKIVLTRIGQRSTYHCPECQK